MGLPTLQELNLENRAIAERAERFFLTALGGGVSTMEIADLVCSSWQAAFDFEERMQELWRKQ